MRGARLLPRDFICTEAPCLVDLDFPARGIIFHDLRHAEVEIGGHQRHPLGLAIDPDHAHRAAQGLEHHHLVGGEHRAHGAVDMPCVGLRLRPHRRRPLGGRAQALALLARPPGLARARRWPGEQGGIHPPAREQLHARAQGQAQRLE